MEKLDEDLMKYIIARIVERAKEAAQDVKEDSQDVLKQGRRLAYYEVLDIIKSELETADINLKDFEIDFDISETLYS